MANIALIIQARMGSTRLPGKVALEIGGHTILGLMLSRLNKLSWRHKLIVATTDDSSDDETESIAKKYGALVFRGSQNDLIQRYLGAATENQIDHIVRLTSDCPFIDPRLVDTMLGFYMGNYKKIDFLTNCFNRTFARGMDIEIFSTEFLHVLDRLCKEPYEREHIAPYVEYNHKNFKFFEFKNSTDHSIYRFTIDYEDDFKTLDSFYKLLGNLNFSYQELMELATDNEHLIFNRHILHKDYQD